MTRAAIYLYIRLHSTNRALTLVRAPSIRGATIAGTLPSVSRNSTVRSAL
jgi:hypothetical protein